MGILELLIDGVAAWRVAFMLVYDGGPGGVFRRVREQFGVVHDDGGEPISWPNDSPFACMGCMAVWVAAALLILPWRARRWLAVAGIAKLLQRWYEN